MASPPDPHSADTVSGGPAPLSARALTTTDPDVPVSAHPLTGVSPAWLAGERYPEARVSGERYPGLTEPLTRPLTTTGDERASAVRALLAERYRHRSAGAGSPAPRLDERPEVDAAHELARPALPRAEAPVLAAAREDQAPLGADQGDNRAEEAANVDGQ